MDWVFDQRSFRSYVQYLLSELTLMHHIETPSSKICTESRIITHLHGLHFVFRSGLACARMLRHTTHNVSLTYRQHSRLQ